MKMTWLARLCGLDPAKATERSIAAALESLASRANSVAVPGTSIYSTPRIAADTDTDPSRNSEPYVVKAVRPGHWQIYERQPDGLYRKYGTESVALVTLQKQAAALNLQARSKASAANEIASLVNEEMVRTGRDYSHCWGNVKSKHPGLFASLLDPSEAQRQQHAARRS